MSIYMPFSVYQHLLFMPHIWCRMVLIWIEFYDTQPEKHMVEEPGKGREEEEEVQSQSQISMSKEGKVLQMFGHTFWLPGGLLRLARLPPSSQNWLKVPSQKNLHDKLSHPISPGKDKAEPRHIQKNVLRKCSSVSDWESTSHASDCPIKWAWGKISCIPD